MTGLYPVSPEELERDRNVRFNFVVNMLDGGFFGMAFGFASLTAVLPLFISQMTDSAIWIGLIPSMHMVGWYLPQVFTAQGVARSARFKPLVLKRTVFERVPFFGLAAVAWFLPGMHPGVSLLLTFILMTLQGLGGGYTATAWQSMIAKVIPARRWGVFFGTQAAAASLAGSLSVVAAGFLLERVESPLSYALCFLLTAVIMVVSWFFLALTREQKQEPPAPKTQNTGFWRSLGEILRRDANFRWFTAARVCFSFATMGFAFYSVYVVRQYGATESQVGIMTGVLTMTQMLVHPLVGWLGDRWSHRVVMTFGALAAALSVGIAFSARSVGWFYPAFMLAGIANVTYWTNGMAMTLEFGRPEERAMYIGLLNTLIGPVAMLAPIFGGRLADLYGYPAAFAASAVGGLLALGLLILTVHNPRKSALA